MMRSMIGCCFSLVLGVGMSVGYAADGDGGAEDKLHVHRFQQMQLTDVYYSEGANFGDINGDGAPDVVYGPYWFAGPDFQQRREIYPARPQPREAYADNFFSWVHDFDADGAADVLTVGFPGKPAYVFRNPGAGNHDAAWERHEVFDSVCNESPQFTNLVGDERPELICTRDGFFGYATIDWSRPLSPWVFHPISEQVAPVPFGHGLGVGDVDGDGRLDLLAKDGWFQQPANSAATRWQFHAAPFAPRGGAEMYAYDVDGDGDNDVVTSLAAHEFGLAWYEQLRDGDGISFQQHLIIGDKPEDNPYGVVFSELHSVNLVDMDGDGLKDIVTGKTYWSHHMQSPQWDAGAVVYWFKLVRSEAGVDWVPFLADGEAGIGRQISVGDLNADGVPDLVVGGMKGCHVLIQDRQAVDRDDWSHAQPRRTVKMASGLDPLEAARHMTVPAGFEATLAAGEPDVHQPVAMALDHRGRVWVAEAYTYPVRAPEGEGRDKIIIFEDTTGDGRLDRRTVFCEGLNLVSGLEVGFGGVWVGAAPYLLFIPDRDGDDRPDGEPQVLLDGFGYEDTHETLNAFNWGPDGWLYGCHGVFTHSRVGKPGSSDAERTPLNAGVWRYHPTRHEFEVFAWGTSNPWGVDFNDRGQAFLTACVIPHLYHFVQGARYQRQGGTHFNPYVFDDIKTIADHAHYAGDIRDHAWWGAEPELPTTTSAAGGGHAHAGAMIYLGDNWPPEYRDRLFMCNIHGNRVNSDLLERSGSGFVGRHGSDLLLANDHWFRGINLRCGPDGGVYLIDWYDPNACHRTNPEIWDRTNGRIYKITYGVPETRRPNLQRLSNDELIELQRHRNEWYVRQARRVLQERGANPQVRAGLLNLLATAEAEPLQLRALWTLHCVGGVDEELAWQLLQSPHEYVRAWTIQLLLERRRASAETLAKLAELARSDSSPVVRLYLASALQRLHLDDRWPIAAELVRHDEDASDHNLPLMIWYGIEPLVVADPERALELAQSSRIPLLTRYLIRRAAGDDDILNSVVESLLVDDDPRRQLVVLDEMLQAFAGRVGIPLPPAWQQAYDQLSDNASSEVRDHADQVAVLLGDRRIFPRMRALLADRDADTRKRRQALELLVRGRDPDAAPALQAAIANAELRGAAIRALAAHSDAATPTILLSAYADFGDDEKRDVVATLASRPAYAFSLLDAIDRGDFPRTDLHAYHIRQLQQLNDDELERRIAEVWGAFRESSADKQARIAAWEARLTPQVLEEADPSNGRRVFSKTCATCHVLFGEGELVGPDLTGSNRANVRYVLDNVVDPGAVLGKDYQMTVVTTLEGQIVSGLVLSETDSALTMRTLNDTVVIAKADVEDRVLSQLSLMPEGLLDQLSEVEVRDLAAYLGSATQVPLRGPRAPIDASAGRVPAAIEGESMQVVEKTDGNVQSQPMGGFTKDRWSGADHLWWTGAKPGSRLVLTLPVESDGVYALELALTQARDYAVVQLSLDGRNLGGPLDMYNAPDVITSGVLTYDELQLSKGDHALGVEILGANPRAVKSYMFGLDFVRLRRE